jgi:hypothetical protein
MCFPISRFIHQVMLPVTLVAFMSACHKWTTVEPGQPFAEEGTEELRITQTHGQWVVLRQSAMVGDSVVGLVNGDSVSFALSEVDKVEVRKTDVAGTVGLVVGIGAAIVAAAFVGFIVGCASGCALSR